MLKRNLIKAAQFYERRVSTLGGQFLRAADFSVAVILEAPTRWSIIEGNVRHYLMPRFPYALYYRRAAASLKVLVRRFPAASNRPAATDWQTIGL